MMFFDESFSSAISYKSQPYAGEIITNPDV